MFLMCRRYKPVVILRLPVQRVERVEPLLRVLRGGLPGARAHRPGECALCPMCCARCCVPYAVLLTSARLDGIPDPNEILLSGVSLCYLSVTDRVCPVLLGNHRNMDSILKRLSETRDK